jgi:hypothetical protein
VSQQLGAAVLDLSADQAMFDAELDRAKAKAIAAAAAMEKALTIDISVDTSNLGFLRGEIERGLLGPMARLAQERRRLADSAAQAEVTSIRRVTAAHTERERAARAAGVAEQRTTRNTGGERVTSVSGGSSNRIWGVRGPEAPGSRMNPIVTVLEAAERTPLGTLAAAVGDSSSSGGPETTTVATSQGSQTRVTNVGAQGAPSRSEAATLAAIQGLRNRSDLSLAERMAMSRRLLADLEAAKPAAPEAVPHETVAVLKERRNRLAEEMRAAQWAFQGTENRNISGSPAAEARIAAASQRLDEARAAWEAAKAEHETAAAGETVINTDKTTVQQAPRGTAAPKESSEGDAEALGAALTMGSRVQQAAILRRLAAEGRGGEVETLLAAGRGEGGGGGGGLVGLLGGSGGEEGGGSSGWRRKALWGAGLFGLAGMGTLGSLAGFGPEHVLLTGLGLLGSAGAGALGGGLLGAGALGKLGVGMGSDAAVMASTISDTTALYQGYTKLHEAVAQYGASSKQAREAEEELHKTMKVTLGGTQGVAAELKVAEAVFKLNAEWDKKTSGARVQASKLLMQGVGLGETYIPLVAGAAEQNFAATNQGLKPLVSWLKGPEGLGIFHQLETEFRTEIPEALKATDQGFEFMAKTIAAASPYTGKLIHFFDELFTKWNSPEGFVRWESTMGKLISDFHLWGAFLKAFGGSIWDLFKNDASTGNSIIVTLTGMLDKLRAWENSTKGKAELHNIFQVHKEEVVALLQLIPALVKGLAPIYMTLAPPLVHAVTGLAEGLAWVLNLLDKLGPAMRDALGGALILAKLGLLQSAISGVGVSLGIVTAKEKTVAETTLGEFVAAQNAATVSSLRMGAAATAEATEIEALGTAMGSTAATSAVVGGESAASGGLFAGVMGKLTGRLGPTLGGAAAGEEETGFTAMLSQYGPMLLKGGLMGGVGAIAGNTVGSLAGAKGMLSTAMTTGGAGAGIGAMIGTPFDLVSGPLGTVLGTVLGAGIGASTPFVVKALTGLFSSGASAAEQHARHQVSALRASEGGGKGKLGPEGPRIEARQEGAFLHAAEARRQLAALESGHGPMRGGSGDRMPISYTPPSASELAAAKQKLKAASEKLGDASAEGLQTGFQTARIMTRYGLFLNIERELDALPVKARKSAALADLAYAAELEAKKELPLGSVRQLLNEINGLFPGLNLKVRRQGQALAEQLARAYELKEAKQRLGQSLSEVNTIYDQSFQKTTAGEQAAMSFLEYTIAHASGPTKRAAEELLDNLQSTFHRKQTILAQNWNAWWQTIASHPTSSQRETMVGHIKEMMEAGVVTAQEGTALINKQLEGELAAVGMPTHITVKGGNLVIKGAGAKEIFGSVGHAVGGLIQFGHSGEAGHDSIPLNVGGLPIRVAPGEQVAVFNRHQLPIVNEALAGYGGLPGLFDAVSKPNYMASGGIVAPKVTGVGALPNIVRGALSEVAKAANSYLGKHKPASGKGAGGVSTAGLSGSLLSIVHQIAGRMGWLGQVGDWLKVIMAESGGSMTAQNPTSSAYGIAQFIEGAAGYAKYGGNASTLAGQLVAMANYIRGRYGSPAAAWAHELADKWYGRGGILGLARGGILSLAGGGLVPRVTGGKVQKLTPGLPRRAKRSPNINAMHFDAFRLIPPLQQMPASFQRHLEVLNGIMGSSGSVATAQERYQYLQPSQELALSEQPYKGEFIVSEGENGEKVTPFEYMPNVEMRVGQLQTLMGIQLHVQRELEHALKLINPLSRMVEQAVDYRKQQIEKIRKRIKALTAKIKRIRKQIQANVSSIKRLEHGKGHKSEIAHLEGANRALGGSPRNVGTGGEINVIEGEIKHLQGNEQTLLGQQTKLGEYVTTTPPWTLGGKQTSGLLPEDRTAIVGLSGIGGKLGETTSVLSQLEKQMGEVGAGALAKQLAVAQKSAGGEESSSVLTELLKQQNEQLVQQLAVSQAQYKVFLGLNNLPPFAGKFHSGGMIPGPVGAERLALVQAGERVKKIGERDAPQIQVIVKDGAVDPNKIEVIAGGVVQRAMRTPARRASRPLPSGGGGI